MSFSFSANLKKVSMNYSVVEYFGCGSSGHMCGYCKQSNSLSHGMWAHRMECTNYEALIDRGWRRSGMYCYKPIMDKTCCPQYTIRCDAMDVKLTKSQKKIVKRFNRYLVNGKQEHDLALSTDNAHSTFNTSSHQDPPHICWENNGKKHKESKSTNSIVEGKPIQGADESKPRCRKAKELRKERKICKLAAQGIERNTTKKTLKNPEKNIEELVEHLPDNLVHRLELRLVQCSPPSSEFTSMFDQEYTLFKKYQMAVHKEKEKDCSKKSFRRFLVDGPLQPTEKLGAYHQQYFLDGKLMAVGVLDILPHAVSSVYFFYDPQYDFLSLGTYSAIKELQLVRHLNKQQPLLKYYYMGYYIHSCLKMKYKGQYKPSYLLCPETYKWTPIEICAPKLDVAKYSRLNEATVTYENMPEVDECLILYCRQAIQFPRYLSLLKNEAERKKQIQEVTEYARLTGAASKDILLYRS